MRAQFAWQVGLYRSSRVKPWSVTGGTGVMASAAQPAWLGSRPLQLTPSQTAAEAGPAGMITAAATARQLAASGQRMRVARRGLPDADMAVMVMDLCPF